MCEERLVFVSFSCVFVVVWWCVGMVLYVCGVGLKRDASLFVVRHNAGEEQAKAKVLGNSSH